MLTDQISADPEIVIGDIVVLKDLVVMSSRSPMCGHNEDHWGLRFFDMSDMFDRELSEAVLKEANQVQNFPLL